MSCYRYIELIPVRAGMVRDPGKCRWSSYHAKALRANDSLTQAHHVYLGLGSNADERRNDYRESFRQAMDDEAIDELRTTINLCVPAGNERFKAQIERHLEQRISYCQRGRPKIDRLLEKPPDQQQLVL